MGKSIKRKEDSKIKAIVMLSGGLDSTLAAKLILQQGIELIAVAFKTPFCDFDCGKGCTYRVRDVADNLGIELRTIILGDEYIELIKNPKYGYGSGMNPCIDCRIMMFRRAKELMEKIGASFIVTGEVLGQRPMSQNAKAMKIIEREAGVEGYVLRPLSAKLLELTIPEKMGWVNREALLAIRGRSRKAQIELAHKLGINEVPNPAGGCLLTDPAFSKRLKDLLQYNPNPTLNDIELLKLGRHFRLSSKAKLIVGRNKVENQKLLLLHSPSDFILEVEGFMGPISLLRGIVDNDLLNLAASITVRYSDAPKDRSVMVNVKSEGKNWKLLANIIDEDKIKTYRI
ncbi:MAG: hypothetical protein QXH53_03430 [Nitrososphaerales archaeon]